MLKCKNITIQNKEKNYLIKNLTFSINQSEIFTLTGSSGIGKSTLLKYICGIKEDYFSYSGEVIVDNKSVNQLHTNKREISMIFQNDLLFPHMNVLENILFATPSNKIRNIKNVKSLLSSLNLESLSYKKINKLSGGEYSRVCLARIMINEPKVLLVDEPFSNLDKETKTLTRDIFYKKIESLKCATLIVTHDEENIYREDKIIRL